MISSEATGEQQSADGSQLIKFKNCRILRNHKIITEDLWVRNGKIIDPEQIFFDEKLKAHLVSKLTIIEKHWKLPKSDPNIAN